MAYAMSDAELREFIITRWRAGFDLVSIVVLANIERRRRARPPIARTDVLAIVRAWIDYMSENKRLAAASRRG